MTNRLTVYDIFAVLVPGVVFIYLMTTTLNRAAGIQIFDWSGGFGDATLLVITGYAVGVFLQAIGNAIVDPVWRWIRGGQPTATLLMQKSGVLSDGFKGETLQALTKLYGELPSPSDSPEYLKALEEKTYRAYKWVATTDSSTERFLAEHHGMRAYAVSFLSLVVIVLGGGHFYSRLNWKTHGVLVGIYLALAVVATWRMENKSVTLARHVLTRFLGLTKEEERKERGGKNE